MTTHAEHLITRHPSLYQAFREALADGWSKAEIMQRVRAASLVNDLPASYVRACEETLDYLIKG